MLFYGPINSTYNMVINGLVTLRSYRKFDFFRINFVEAIEKSANSTFCYVASNRWIGLRLELLCNIFGITTAILCFALKNNFENKEVLTFSLQIILDIVFLFSISVRMYAECQNMMTSSQRIYSYTQLESEDEIVKPSDKALTDSNWPTKGDITFERVSMKYREGMEPSLVGLDCHV